MNQIETEGLQGGFVSDRRSSIDNARGNASRGANGLAWRVVGWGYSNAVRT